MVQKFIDNSYNKKKIIMTRKSKQSAHFNQRSIQKVKNYLIKNNKIIQILKENFMLKSIHLFN